MAAKTAKRSTAIVCGALIVGFLSGCIVMTFSGALPGFLDRSIPVARREEVTNIGPNTVTYYSVPEKWLDVIDHAKKELPNALERDTTLGGFRAKVLTVPRVENGRIQLFYPPDEEITFLPRRLGLNHNGRVIALDHSAGEWTGIQLRIYRRPKAFDGIVDWIRKNCRV